MKHTFLKKVIKIIYLGLLVLVHILCLNFVEFSMDHEM